MAISRSQDTASVDQLLLKTLERTGCGGILISTDGTIISFNGAAYNIIKEMFGGSGLSVEYVMQNGRQLIKQLLLQGKTRVQFESENWVLIERADRRPLIMHSVPFIQYNSQSADHLHTMLMLIDLENVPQISSSVLERLFSLTPAEIRLAMLLVYGSTTAEAAEILGIRVATARSQLASVFSKTRTTRQAELVRLISRLSILP